MYSMAAFTNSINTPSVNMIAGKLSSTTSGRISALTIPKIRAATNKTPIRSSYVMFPTKICADTHKPTILTSQENRIRFNITAVIIAVYRVFFESPEEPCSLASVNTPFPVTRIFFSAVRLRSRAIALVISFSNRDFFDRAILHPLFNNTCQLRPNYFAKLLQ